MFGVKARPKIGNSSGDGLFTSELKAVVRKKGYVRTCFRLLEGLGARRHRVHDHVKYVDAHRIVHVEVPRVHIVEVSKYLMVHGCDKSEEAEDGDEGRTEADRVLRQQCC